jgi:DNA-directed RNA polymerase
VCGNSHIVPNAPDLFGTSLAANVLWDSPESDTTFVQTTADTCKRAFEVPDLPVQLRNPQGSQLLFEDLHRKLRHLESSGLDVAVLGAAHEFLLKFGLQETRLSVISYINADGKLSQEAFELFMALDAQLIAHHNILLEDLSDAILQRWVQEPNLFSDKIGPEQVIKMLYGSRTRFPIRSQPSLAGDALPHPASARRRQLTIERLTHKAALQEYTALREQQCKDGRGSEGQKVWMNWVEAMTSEITRLKSESPESLTAHQRLLCQLSVSAEVLSIITCQTVLNNIFVPWSRRKNDKKNGRESSFGSFGDDVELANMCIPYAQAVVKVGDAVTLEESWLESQNTLPFQRLAGNRLKVTLIAQMLRRSKAQSEEEELKRHTVPIGAALIGIMLQLAEVEILESGRNRGQKALAFSHTVKREGKKTVGYIELNRRIGQLMEVSDDLLSFLDPKHQPMIIRPRLWRPSTENPEGGFLLHKVPFIRTSNQKATHLKVYDTQRISRVMDVLGNTRWRINKRVLHVMEAAWDRDLNIADLPPRTDPEVEEKPEDFEELPEDEQKAIKLRRYNAKKAQAELRSERPTFALKLRVAQDFEHAAELYFPHNIDFRGRAYPIPPHLNHIGDDVCRGLLMFADPKPLGEEGEYWLKISLANLLGKDKLPFQERIAYIDESKDWILQVADDPLGEANLPRWIDAPDGPWQTLARILELADAWRSPDVRTFLSSQPVHLDGSCNGLQHYAALGRDEEGAKAVNLTPSDKPQDVYSIVLTIVKEKVGKHADIVTKEGEDVPQHTRYAKRLQDLNLLQRKVVKQTIMTICYGVTSVGAKEQVQRQLGYMVADQVDPKEMSALAGYLSQLVLKSIDEVFERAMKIKKWFDKVSTVLNRVEVPVQWYSPIGLVCTQPYRKRKKVHVQTQLQKVTLNGKETPKVDKSKQRMGFPPNFVHSLDATHMMMVAEGCAEHGIAFAGVHDSFWTHACDTAILNKIIRDKFVELHRQPILSELELDLQLHLGSLSHELPALPEQSTLNLELVKDSLYMFD